MTAYSLLAHPDRPPSRVAGVDVTIGGDARTRTLRYRVSGAEAVLFPPLAAPARADELWRTTCFELFLMFDDEEHYVEFNFSPSGAWAAYAFEGYREGMAALDLARSPRIVRHADGIQAELDSSGLPHGELRMALTAVIEEVDGTKSYWSLAHPPGAPDFHHPACFAATLPPPDAA